MNLQAFIAGTITFLNSTIVPFLLAIAFSIFIWNAVQYFIIQGDSEEGQTKAKSLALWSISAFVIIISLWGIVNTIVKDLGLTNTLPCPDYILGKVGTGCK